MAEPIGGTAYLKVDGAQYPLRGNFVVSPSRVERAMVAGQDRVHGYTELPRVPWIEGDITLVPELNTEDVENIVNATVTAELINGKTYVLTKAVCKSALELQTRDGMVRIRWEGETCEEMG